MCGGEGRAPPAASADAPDQNLVTVASAGHAVEIAPEYRVKSRIRRPPAPSITRCVSNSEHDLVPVHRQRRDYEILLTGGAPIRLLGCALMSSPGGPALKRTATARVPAPAAPAQRSAWFQPCAAHAVTGHAHGTSLGELPHDGSRLPYAPTRTLVQRPELAGDRIYPRVGPNNSATSIASTGPSSTGRQRSISPGAITVGARAPPARSHTSTLRAPGSTTQYSGTPYSR